MLCYSWTLRVASILVLTVVVVVNMLLERGNTSLTMKSRRSLVKPSSPLDRLAQMAMTNVYKQNDNHTRHSRPTSFNLTDFFRWNNDTRGSGGLMDDNRIFLGKTYLQAHSVFEFGLGESTLLAQYVKVPMYVGVDSDLSWVQHQRQQFEERQHDPNLQFHFVHAPLGQVTASWGNPLNVTAQTIWDYQITTLYAQPYAFDVYFVDGRFRMACAIVSFLHAFSRPEYNCNGATVASSKATATLTTKVLIHDCFRAHYHIYDHLFRVEMHGSMKNRKGKTVSICQLQLQPHVNPQLLLDAWENVQDTVA